MKKKICLFGAGGHAVKIADIIRENDNIFYGFFSKNTKGIKLYGSEVLGYIDDYNSIEDPELYFHIAIGNNFDRFNIYNEISDKKKQIKLISISSKISVSAKINDGTSVGVNAIIQSNSIIGTCCIIDSSAIVEHDCKIGDFVNILPGAILCGNVTLGNNTIIGAGSTIIEKTKIGENVLIGAGSLVLNDIESNSIAYGVPAKVINKRCFGDKYLK